MKSIFLILTLVLVLRETSCTDSFKSHKQPAQSTKESRFQCVEQPYTGMEDDGGKCLKLEIELREAAAAGDIEKMKSLIADGANVNANEDSHLLPLYAAIIEGQAEAVKFLIQQGANVNKTQAIDDTPLKAAVRAKRPDIFAILVAHGAY